MFVILLSLWMFDLVIVIEFMRLTKRYIYVRGGRDSYVLACVDPFMGFSFCFIAHMSIV